LAIYEDILSNTGQRTQVKPSASSASVDISCGCPPPSFFPVLRGVQFPLLMAYELLQTGYPLKIVDSRSRIGIDELKEMAKATFGDLVKAVVDVNLAIMAVDAELHADEEALLIESASVQNDLWGINLYPELEGPDFVEFDSMINFRPSQGNRSRGVDNPEVREIIRKIVENLVIR